MVWLTIAYPTLFLRAYYDAIIRKIVALSCFVGLRLELVDPQLPHFVLRACRTALIVTVLALSCSSGVFDCCGFTPFVF